MVSVAANLSDRRSLYKLAALIARHDTRRSANYKPLKGAMPEFNHSRLTIHVNHSVRKLGLMDKK